MNTLILVSTFAFGLALGIIITTVVPTKMRKRDRENFFE